MPPRRPHRSPDYDRRVLRTIGIQTRSLELVKRFRISCIEDGRTHEQQLAAFLDQRDRNRARARNLMAHPLHRDGAEAATVDA
jgi:hypothetical protein